METPPAKDVRAGTRFSVNTPNGIVEFCVVKFARGRGADKHVMTVDGTTRKQVVSQAECSIRFNGNECPGRFTMDQPMENGTWAVRAEFVIRDEEFWEGAKTPF